MTDAFDWDDAYDNRSYIAGAEAYPDRWAAAAAAFRARLGDRVCELAYGEHPRERLDLFAPDGAPAGLVVFVHGGYWRAFDKSSWSHFAAGALDRGWAVALPSYTLAPEARIAEISRQIAAATARAAEEVAGAIRLIGHSAGGHLVTRMIAGAPLLSEAVAARIDRVVSVSGLHDLRPLMKLALNETFRIDAAEAAAESPALHAAREGVAVTAWVGGDERPEFVRQSQLLAEAWPTARAEIEPGRHHYDVLDGLEAPGSPLITTLLD